MGMSEVVTQGAGQLSLCLRQQRSHVLRPGNHLTVLSLGSSLGKKSIIFRHTTRPSSGGGGTVYDLDTTPWFCCLARGLNTILEPDMDKRPFAPYSRAHSRSRWAPYTWAVIIYLLNIWEPSHTYNANRRGTFCSAHAMPPTPPALTRSLLSEKAPPRAF